MTGIACGEVADMTGETRPNMFGYQRRALREADGFRNAFQDGWQIADRYPLA